MSPSADPLPFQGLDEAEAERLLAEHGPNIIQRAKTRGLLDIVRGTLREPMFLFLVAAAVLYLVVGDLGEGLFLVVGAIVSIGLVVLQESRSERALAALRQFAEGTARVVRGGSERTIPVRELVPGDVILVGEGERLPADAILLAGDILTVDESVLTGESVPVTKPPTGGRALDVANRQPGGDATPLLFAGTMIVRGQGLARVSTHRRGARRSAGSARRWRPIESEPTLLQQTTARLVGAARRLGLRLLPRRGPCLRAASRRLGRRRARRNHPGDLAAAGRVPDGARHLHGAGRRGAWRGTRCSSGVPR